MASWEAEGKEVKERLPHRVTEGEMDRVPHTVGLIEYVLETVPLRHCVTVLVPV